MRRWLPTLHGIALASTFAIASIVRAAPIAMPPGSTVWMHFEASPCPDADGDDCLGSNLPGPNPPNGIPLSTFTTPTTGPSTGLAEVLPARVRTFTQGRLTTFVRASFQDTYTVHGSAAGSFSIPITLSATGTARTYPVTGTLNFLSGANVEVEIGTFDTNPVAMQEQFRVTPFDASTTAIQIFPFANTSTPSSQPISVSTSYSRPSNVGDVFTIGYGINSGLSTGELDLLENGAQISMTLPDGVWVTSSLGGVWGAPPPAAPIGPWVPVGTAVGLIAVAMAAVVRAPQLNRPR